MEKLRTEMHERDSSHLWQRMILFCSGLATVAIVVWAACSDDHTPVAAPVFEANHPPKPEPAVALRGAPTQKKDLLDPNDQIRLPDGSYVPALNGVATAVSWGKRAFSPIVGRNVTAQGVEWYVHEDGSQSTTIRVTGSGQAAREVRSMILFARASRDVRPLKPGIAR